MKSSKLIIDKKRCGEALGSAEIRQFINGFVSGEVPDYQMSALAMAICCRGMTDRETADLTDVMMKSGRVLQWGDLITADKHSTGGVGDKLSLIIQPLVSSCNVAVPSLTGRALGLTGGTADKLETIPGYNASLSIEDFTRVVQEVGVSMTVQTEEITPADRKLYALRDVTATVASIPLIVASILSKKLAEGAGTLVFDVKCGSGAFMKTIEDASLLARRLVDGAKAAGRKAAALVSDMSMPLGSAIGNANEVKEAIDILSGSNNPLYREEIELSIELAALMVSLAKDIELDEARVQCKTNLSNGSALVKFKEMVEAQGGNLKSFEKLLSKPVFRFKIQAVRSGYISSIDAGTVAAAAFELGTGRKKQGDKIDPLAGIKLDVKMGDRVCVGTPLATLEKSDSPDGLEAAAANLLKAFTISPNSPEGRSIILQRI
ncbi:MAG: thymidine phosphorylase [Kiritimatiellae bacterium]|nr:thymidine phosphorylase [Kiritimatiellia bacterium]